MTMNTALGFFLAFLASLAQAETVPPDVLVKMITDDVAAAIRKDADIRAGDTRKAADLIEAKIVPHFNFTRMARIAMARNWRSATPEQQKEIAAQFKTLLIRTYSTALTNYRDQEIDYKPLRSKPDDTEVTVKSDVKPTGATQPVSIDYELEKTDNGWKIYDVKVDGVSLVTTYRDTFATEVREHGIDGLIKALAAKNREPLSPKAGKS
ncbi:MAG TPA: ABC transporter substrate-binding protein [Burkholderiales bacterium]|nr:ABC transporter substrate-binding protein [Burkholderiales bacterium]